MRRVVVVGGGAAGASVVRTLQGAGHPGEIIMLCREPVAPYDRTMLSKESLIDPDAPPRPLLSEESGSDDSLIMRTAAEVTDLDLEQRHVRVGDDEVIGYDDLVWATGAAPRRLDLPGATHERVHMLREIGEWGPLRDAVVGGRRLVIIGGGLIGLEAAAAARRHGGDVTVIEVADRLMGRVLPPLVADVVAAEHDAQGVTIELGARPVAILDAPPGDPVGVQLADGRVLTADAVLISVGSRPRSDVAEAAGLRVDGGIVVDQHLRTSDPHVLAAGDVVRVMAPDGTLAARTESWTPAVSMGRHVARTILGQPSAYDEVPWMWSDQYQLRIQAAGAGMEGSPQVTRGSVDDPAGLAVFRLDQGRVVGVAGVSRGNGVGRTVRAGQLLIQHGVPVDAAALADLQVELRGLIPRR